jgi:hypothetical protein
LLKSTRQPSQHGNSKTDSGAGFSGDRIVDFLPIPSIWPCECSKSPPSTNRSWGERSPLRQYVLENLPPLKNLLTGSTVTGEPEGLLWRAESGYGPGSAGTNRINATLLSVMRKSMAWSKQCEISNEHGIPSSITRGLSSTTCRSQRSSNDEHKQRPRHSVYMVRLHVQHSSYTVNICF